jgi:hypothetical protein
VDWIHLAHILTSAMEQSPSEMDSLFDLEKETLPYMELGGSFLCSQEPGIGLWPQSLESDGSSYLREENGCERLLHVLSSC